MDRRAFLATAAAVVAGCGQGDGTDDESPDATDGDGDGTPTATSRPTASSTPTATATPTAGPAELTVTDVATPSTLEIGTPFTVTVTVENGGGRADAFSAPVEAQYGTGDWETTDATVEVEVPPGDTATAEAEIDPHPYVEPATFRVADADPVARPRFVGRELAFGESYRFPNGIELTVETPSFAETYEYETGEGTAEADPTGNERWLVATVRAENTGDEPADAPLASDIAYYREGEQEFAFQHIDGNQSRYEGGELEPGGETEGDFPSDVPRDSELGDFRVEHDAEYEGGRVTVNWRAES